MPAGYEAKARITTDVSPFKQASQEAARATRGFADAVTKLNNALEELNQSARSSADAIKPFQQSSNALAKSQKNFIDVSKQASEQSQQQKVNYAKLAREIINTDEQLQKAQEAMELGVQTGENLDGTVTTLTQRLRGLRQTYDALNDEQRQAVDNQLELIRAQRESRDAHRMARNLAEAERDLNEVRNDSVSSLQSLGKELDRLEQQQRPFNALIQEGATLTNEQIAAYDLLEDRVRQINNQMDSLSQAQREIVEESRQMAAATRLSGQATRELNATTQVSENHIKSLVREYMQLESQQEIYNDLTRRGINLTQQQQDSFDTLSDRMQAITREISGYSQQQRELANQTFLLARAQEQARTTSQLLNESVQQSTRFFDHVVDAIDQEASELFALNALLTDVEQSLNGVGMAAINMVTEMGRVFSVQEMATAHLARVTQDSDAEVGQLANTIQDLSERIPVPFDELARIGVLGAQVGIADENMTDFIETVSLFSATTDVAEDQAALLFARIVQMTNIEETQIRNLGAAVSELGSNSAATEQEILTTIESIGTVTTQAGLSKEAILGLGSALASLRVRPELARGAAQRAIFDLQQTAIGATEGMDRLAEIVGVSREELARLSQVDTEEFFFRVLEGLNGMLNSGENLIPVLREIGITNTRDADTVARLAGNYQLLQDSVDLATESFSQATFLQEESSRLFDTMTTRVQLLRNAFMNFISDAFSAIAPFVSQLAEAATAAIQFLDSIGAAPLVGWGAAVTAVVGTLALLGGGIAAAARGILALRNVVTTVTTALASYRTTALTAGTATTGMATSMNTAAASSGRFATAATVAGTAVRGLVRGIALFTGVGAVLAGAVTAFQALSSAIGDSNEALLDAQQSNLQAAGGMEALQTALREDTEAWKEAQRASIESSVAMEDTARNAVGYARMIGDANTYRLETTRDVAEATKEEQEETANSARNNLWFQEQIRGSTEALRGRREEMEGDTSTIDENISKQESLRDTINENTDAFDRQTVAIGDATREVAAGSLEAAFMETNIAQTTEAMQELRDTGVDFGAALTMEMGDAGDGVEYLDNRIAALNAQIGPLENEWAGVANSVEAITFGMVDWRTSTQQASDALISMRDNLEATRLTIDEALQAQNLFGNETIVLGENVSFTEKELQEMKATAALMDLEIKGLGMTLGDLRDTFTEFVDPLQAWEDAQEEANQAVIDANEDITSLAEDADVSFGSYLDNLEEMRRNQMNWARNLLNIADEVPPAVLADLAAMGRDGADIVAGLVNATDEETDRFIELWKSAGSDVLDEFVAVYSDFLQKSATAGNEGGQEFADNILAQLAEGSISFKEAINELTDYAEEEFDESDPTTEPEVDGNRAQRQMVHLLQQIRNFQARSNDAAVTRPSVETRGFWDEITSWWSSVANWFAERSVTIPLSAGGGGGGDLGGLVGVPQAFSEGGWVRGRGGSTEDKNPALLSDDEFVVRASRAQEFGPLLEWINNSRGSGNTELLTPNFVPNDIIEMPRRPLNTMDTMPNDVFHGRSDGRMEPQEKIIVNVNNQYPQAEPTSTTVNRALAHAAALNGLG